MSDQAKEHDRTDGNGLLPAPTMRDIAAQLGVSRQLVSMVLRGVEGPSSQSRQRILKTARDLGYRPNSSARLLTRNRTNLLGVVFSMRNPFQVRFVERLFDRAAEHGFGVVPGPMTAERSMDTVLAQLLEERVEGAIIFNPERDSAVLDEALGRIPVSLIGEWIDDATVDNIHVDETAGLNQAVQHLVGHGHCAIAYVGGAGGRVGHDRQAAYEAAMQAAGLADTVRVFGSDFSEEGGADAARRIVELDRDARPTAIICCGDQCATGALAIFNQHQVAVPDEMSLIGFDDSYLAALSYQQLTSVHQDVDASVDAALASVLERVEGSTRPARRIPTRTRLVVRASTGARS
ncbi:LacI family DNA-binding transcriptional regulator [Curtobacterium sp. NPDC089689]|uniref:LacI family DNA-binding transcriptional regulator n=1 Tax=Curtobacterium sp. NPDC089689 TaxID=3363968 RepID=UPI00381F754C